MNSSSEPVPACGAAYPPLIYASVGEPEEAEPAPSEEQSPPDAAPAGPSAEEILATRMEEQRHALTAHFRQETQREVQREREQIARALETFTGEREEYFRQVEAEVVQLALAIARRLLHRESQIDPRLLAGLVAHELRQMEAASSIRLLVAPDALGYWKELAPGLPRAVEVAAERALAAGEVRIESSLGATTVSFEHELKEIERGFFDLMAHRPASVPRAELRVQ